MNDWHTPETTPEGWLFCFDAGRAYQIIEFFDGWYVDFTS